MTCCVFTVCVVRKRSASWSTVQSCAFLAHCGRCAVKVVTRREQKKIGFCFVFSLFPLLFPLCFTVSTYDCSSCELSATFKLCQRTKFTAGWGKTRAIGSGRSCIAVYRPSLGIVLQEQATRLAILQNVRSCRSPCASKRKSTGRSHAIICNASCANFGQHSDVQFPGRFPLWEAQR